MYDFVNYVLAIICCLLISANAGDPLVETKYGYVLGSREVSRNNRTFLSFKRIPYAKPPIENFRFKAPEPPSVWNSPLNATVDAPICLQVGLHGARLNQILGQEDCLYLNIFVPQRNNTELLPVMVFIHGGGFVEGSSLLYGPEYILDKDVILVTFNYRLGAFGLLSTVDDESPGNYAFKDQVLALKFVNENIENFGGDKTKITIFGESAGSMSVHFHLVSPLSKGLFQQAICESKVILDMFTDIINENQLALNNNLADAVGCIESIGNSKKLLECLRKVDSADIARNYILSLANVNAVIEIRTELNPEPFLEKSPKDYIKDGEFQKVPWIIGVNQDEGIIVAAAELRQKALLDVLNANFEATLNFLLGIGTSLVDINDLDNIFKNITEFYLEGDTYVDIEDPNRVQGFIDLITDQYFVYSTYQTIVLQYLQGNNNIWLYNFDYRGNISYTDLYAGTADDIDFDWGVAHGDELPYLFYIDDVIWGNRKLDGTDLNMSEDLVSLWTNFAIFGDPDPTGNYNWRKLSFNGSDENLSENFNFLNITGRFGESPKYNSLHGFLPERVNFWSQQRIKENDE